MSGSAVRRRGLLLTSLGLVPAGLAGCGFQPVYGPEGERSTAAGGDPSLTEQLASVRVGPIGERTGQLLRRSLQRRLEGLRPGTPARYDLAASISFQAESLGFRRDGTATRVRYIATGRWVLATAAVPPVVVDRGMARTFDDYNTPDLQFFAADASRDDMERRLVDEISGRIALGVAVALRQRMQG